MNTMTDFSGDTAAPHDDAPDRALADLLAPIAPDEPCGTPALFDPVFTEIRLLREEDDPSLPMRQWERPLKQADWPAIEARCVDMLATRSKHLQIAVWLAEAWMRRHGYAGLRRGLRLLDGLLHAYWEPLHPRIEDDGDCDLRLAPLEWLNEALGQGLAVHAALLPLEGWKPPYLTLAEWDRLTAQDMAAAPVARGEEAPPTRADVCALARLAPDALRDTREAVADSLASLDSVHALLADRLGAEAPHLARLQATLEAARRVLAQLEPEDDGPVFEPAAVLLDEDVPAPLAPAPSLPSPSAPARWRNRAEAYATLAALADYLAEVEPHSPVPFLIRRALHWGALPLPELIAEIIREEGDLNRLVGVLGLKM